MQWLRKAGCTEAVRGCFSSSLFILQRSNACQEYRSVHSRKGQLWAEVKPRAYTSAHLALDLHRTHQSDANSNQKRLGHVFLTWGWQYLISVCQRLLVKLLQQKIGPKNWILYGCSYHTWENMQHVWRDSSLTERGLFPVVSINCSKDNLKKIKVNLLIFSQKAMHMTKLLAEVNAIKLDFENLWAPRGVSCANLFALYLFNLSISVCMKLNMCYSLCDTDSHRDIQKHTISMRFMLNTIRLTWIIYQK